MAPRFSALTVPDDLGAMGMVGAFMNEVVGHRGWPFAWAPFNGATFAVLNDALQPHRCGRWACGLNGQYSDWSYGR